MTTVNTSRRTFIKQSAAITGGLVIGFQLPFGGRFALAQQAAAKVEPNAFIRIGADNSVTVLVKHLEFGQGVLTSLPMLVAEELECDWARVRSEHAPAAPAYFHTAFGIQMTGGSSSISNSWEQLRTAGAMARTMLVQAAAQRWNTDAANCKVDKGIITGPGGKRATFGELAEAASKLPTPDKVALKPASAYKIIGKPTKRIDAPGKVNGSAIFGIDVTKKQVPNLHTAVVARAPVFGAKVKSFNSEKVSKIPGVTHVVEIGSGVAVVGKTYWAVKRGRDALTVEWDLGANSTLSTAGLREQYRKLAEGPGLPAKKADDPEAIKKAAKTVAGEFEFPFLAHAPMEPLNCTVELTADKCRIWSGTQFQTIDQGAAAKVAGLPPEKVEINTLIAGGGFGRRANPTSDYIVDAVEVAKAAKVPVKVVWSREDDIRGGYYRPMYLHKVDAGLDKDGKLVGWNHAIVGQSIIAGTAFEQFLVKDGVDATSVEGVADSHYAIPNFNVQLMTVPKAVPSLWWRSVGHTHTAFVMETVIDELAKAAGKDPLAFRKELLAKSPRHLAVLDMLAQKSGWGKPVEKGRALGLAIHESFGSVCGQVAEVSVDKDKIRVHKVTAVVDCGTVVNPLSAEAQVQSAIAYGLAAALYSEVTFKDGKVDQSNFHDYRVLRMDDMPRVEAHFIASTNAPSGLGEPGTPPIAPAVANAVAALTGKRLRKMPFTV